jgi:hypothetical protein
MSPWVNHLSNLSSDDSFEPHTEAARVAIDQLGLSASGIRSVMLCNTVIYGSTLGLERRAFRFPHSCAINWTLVAIGLMATAVRRENAALPGGSKSHPVTAPTGSSPSEPTRVAVSGQYDAL